MVQPSEQLLLFQLDAMNGRGEEVLNLQTSLALELLSLPGSCSGMVVLCGKVC